MLIKKIKISIFIFLVSLCFGLGSFVQAADSCDFRFSIFSVGNKIQCFPGDGRGVLLSAPGSTFDMRLGIYQASRFVTGENVCLKENIIRNTADETSIGFQDQQTCEGINHKQEKGIFKYTLDSCEFEGDHGSCYCKLRIYTEAIGGPCLSESDKAIKMEVGQKVDLLDILKEKAQKVNGIGECTTPNVLSAFTRDNTITIDKCERPGIVVKSDDGRFEYWLTYVYPFGDESEVSTVDYSSLNKLGSATTIQTLIGRAIKVVMGILGSLALLMFIYGGMLWMTARGNAQQAEKAMQVLLWAGMGVVVILASYAIVDFVFEAFR